jgi:radical SAM superfamily enzyme YgiQ (UPF0313 family)
MNHPVPILLVSCYELGHQPFNLASPLAYLQRAGCDVTAIDASVEPLAEEAVARAALVAVSVPMHTALRLGTLIAQRVRSINPTAHIVFFGLYASLNADYLLRTCADSVIGGEYEEPILALARAIDEGYTGEIPGVSTRDGAAAPALARTQFALPDRAALPPLDRYAHLQHGNSAVLAGYVEATRGCLHTCLHCPITPIYQGRLIVVPREIVLGDIRQQVQAGARHITFGDPDFLNGPTHSLRIVRAMHAEFPHLTFDATIKIEHILEHRAIFPELRELGCVFVVSAVESLSDRVLTHLAKGHTRSDVAAALDIMNECGIPLRPSLVAFTPWTTADDYVGVLEFVAEHRMIEQVDPVQYAIRLLVPPGSALLNEPDAHEWLGELDEEAFTYRWDHPDPAMDELYRRVSEVVEQTQHRGLSTAQTFDAVRELALRAAGKPEPMSASAAPGRIAVAERPLPHLTESWFC